MLAWRCSGIRLFLPAFPCPYSRGRQFYLASSYRFVPNSPFEWPAHELLQEYADNPVETLLTH